MSNKEIQATLIGKRVRESVCELHTKHKFAEFVVETVKPNGNGLVELRGKGETPTSGQIWIGTEEAESLCQHGFAGAEIDSKPYGSVYASYEIVK